MKIKILYEDSNILAIEKPSGILAHSDKTGSKENVLDWAKKKYPKVELVHRLDRETSGVMLLAKNLKAHEFLKKQFMDRVVKKVYHVVVSGSVKNDHGMINKPIGRSPKDFRRHLAGRGARGDLREAITEYKVLKRFEAKPEKIFLRVPHSSKSGTLATKKSSPVLLKKFTYLEVRPKTGRTHQIRVHMKYINHPVVCDPLYNPEGFCPKQISRLALHAKYIEFKNLSGKIIKVESKLPKFFP